MQTLGDIIDQLITVDMKLFANQENIQNESYLQMGEGELRALITKSKQLNNQRSTLIDEFNRKLKAVIDGSEPIEFLKHKT